MATVIGSVILGASQFAGRARGSAAHRAVQRDLDLLKRLPEESESKDMLLRQIDEGVRKMIVDRQHRRREPAGIAVAIVLMLVGGYLFWQATRSTSFALAWLVFAALFLLIGSYGFIDSVQRRERTPNGKPS